MSAVVMPGHSPSKTGVNALMAGHPRLADARYCAKPRRSYVELSATHRRQP